MGKAQKLRKRLARAVKIAVAVVLVLAALNLFVIERGRVRLNSMEPSLSNGDWVLFEKVAARRGGLRRFDIVVFKAPRDPDRVYIKRVIGLPSEVVEAREGKLFVDDAEVALPEDADWGNVSFGPSLVEQAHYFVAGDNPAESVDSREWGGVPRDYVLGRVIWRFWPVGKWRVFGRKSPLTRGKKDADQGVQADG